MHCDLRQASVLSHNVVNQKGMVLCLALVLINLLLLCALASWELVNIVTQVVRHTKAQTSCEAALTAIQHDVMRGDFHENCQRNVVNVTTFYEAAPARAYSHMPCQRQTQQLQVGWQVTPLQSTTANLHWRALLLCYVPRYELTLRRSVHFTLQRSS